MGLVGAWWSPRIRGPAWRVQELSLSLFLLYAQRTKLRLQQLRSGTPPVLCIGDVFEDGPRCLPSLVSTQMQGVCCSSDDEETSESEAHSEDEEIEKLFAPPRPPGGRRDGALEWLEGRKFFSVAFEGQPQCYRCLSVIKNGWLQDVAEPQVFCRRCMPALVGMLGH